VVRGFAEPPASGNGPVVRKVGRSLREDLKDRRDAVFSNPRRAVRTYSRETACARGPNATPGSASEADDIEVSPGVVAVSEPWDSNQAGT
jgi:hypothetical protein